MPPSRPSSGPEPFVSVITPVYNGEKYLRECIESVLAQSFANWEYIIVDNCSTDRTGEIARQFAARDNRIRIVRNDSLLPAVRNWNFALRQISAASRYCKELHADDVMLPECLQRMVELAESYPTVGLVSAYRIKGSEVGLAGLPYPSSYNSGRSIARQHLLDAIYLYGTPSSVLIRADIVRSQEMYYNEGNYSSPDVEACTRVLRDADFGFVHQVLTMTRVHPETLTSKGRRMNVFSLGKLMVLHNYGPVFLSATELRQQKKKWLRIHYTYLGKSLLRKHVPGFWTFHRTELAKLGYAFRPARMVIPLLTALYQRTVLALLTPDTPFSRKKAADLSLTPKHSSDAKTIGY